MEGGKGYVGGQAQDWMGCLEGNLSLFKYPTKEKQWILEAEVSGQWFRRAAEAAAQYMKH